MTSDTPAYHNCTTDALLSIYLKRGLVLPLDRLDDRMFLIMSLREYDDLIMLLKEHDTIGSVPPRVVPRSVRYEVMKRQQWRCNSCGMRIRYSRDSAFEGGVCHIDHIHPYSDAVSYPRGPSLINEPANLQALCETCNLRKGRSQKV